MKRLRMLVPILVLTTATSGLGCASQETRTTETTTTTQPADTSPTQPVATSQSTIATTTTNDSGHSSLLGATANFVWTVVSLPFRIVGDVIGEIV